jgi:hypothetical protein
MTNNTPVDPSALKITIMPMDRMMQNDANMAGPAGQDRSGAAAGCVLRKTNAGV